MPDNNNNRLSPQDAKARPEGQKTNKNLRAWLAISLLTLLALGISWRLISPANFILNVQANTNVVQLLRSSESLPQKWRMVNTVVCLPSADSNTLPKSLKKLTDQQWRDACGQRSVPVFSTDAEQTLTLLAAGKVTFRRLKSGLLLIALRGAKGGGPFAQLSYTQSDAVVTLKGSSNMIVEPAGLNSDKAAYQSEGVHLFPFAAEVVVGEDVRWSAQDMLLHGHINVYRDSELAAGERSKVATEELLMGDRIKLSFFKRGKDVVFPKGFVRLDADIPNLDVMAFSDVNAVTISRYGDTEYGYRLGWFKRIIADPLLTIQFSLVLGTIALVGALLSIASGKDMLGAARGLARILRKQWGKQQSDA